MLRINTRVKIIQCACGNTSPLVVGLEGIIVMRGTDFHPECAWDWLVRFINYSIPGNPPSDIDKPIAANEGFFDSCMLRPILDPKAKEFLIKCAKPNDKIKVGDKPREKFILNSEVGDPFKWG